MTNDELIRPSLTDNSLSRGEGVLKMELKDAVCIVTGSATGIGAACALTLAGKACRVVVNYTKSEAEAHATAAECERRGADALVVRADVSVDADCRRLAQTTL